MYQRHTTPREDTLWYAAYLIAAGALTLTDFTALRNTLTRRPPWARSRR